MGYLIYYIWDIRKHLKYLKSLHKNSTLVVGIVGDKDAKGIQT